MKSPIIVALDYPELDMATGMLDRLDPDMTRVKVGKEMFTRFGPAMVEACMQRGFEVFLDLKFHDIPNTVAGACRSAADLGVWMMNVHASGGRRMMEAAEALPVGGGIGQPGVRGRRLAGIQTGEGRVVVDGPQQAVKGVVPGAEEEAARGGHQGQAQAPGGHCAHFVDGRFHGQGTQFPHHPTNHPGKCTVQTRVRSALVGRSIRTDHGKWQG